MLIADRHNTFQNVLQECIILRLLKRTELSQPYVTNIRAISNPNDLTDPQSAHPVSSKRVLLGDEYDGAFYIGRSELDYRVFQQDECGGRSVVGSWPQS